MIKLEKNSLYIYTVETKKKEGGNIYIYVYVLILKYIQFFSYIGKKSFWNGIYIFSNYIILILHILNKMYIIKRKKSNLYTLKKKSWKKSCENYFHILNGYDVIIT